MDLFDERLLRFLAALENYKVAYIVVGGYAVNLHGYRRFTENFDIWIKSSIENKLKLSQAFHDSDLELENKTFSYTLSNSLPLTILTHVKGLQGIEFDDCYRQALTADIDNIKVPVLSLKHLITYKKNNNRPKDRIDVEALELIQTLQQDPAKLKGMATY